MKQSILFFPFSILVLTAGAQNLVANGGFEDVNICTEYTAPCSPSAWTGASYVAIGYERQPVPAFHGSHYLRMVVEDKQNRDSRNYWQTKLLCPLIQGQQYKISFYVGAYGSRFIPADLGIYFSGQSLYLEPFTCLNKSPSVAFTDANVSRVRKSQWLKVDAVYTANGDERYLALGNFLTDNQMIRHDRVDIPVISYCIDDFVIQPADNKYYCADTSLVRQQLYDDHDRHVVPKSAQSPAKNDSIMRQQPPPQKIDTVVIPDVLFAFDKSILTNASRPLLDSIARMIANSVYQEITVEGHTDNKGSHEYNTDLSYRRAKAVADFIISRGIDPGKVKINGKAELYPVADNSTAAGRAKNRRVEILILRK